MAKIKKIYHVICEGSSEVAYLQELNKYIREIGLHEGVYVLPYNLAGVFPTGESPYKYIKKAYSKVTSNKKNTDEIFIWLDNDVFKRNNGLSKDKLHSILKGFSGIKYNYENFEDFIISHLSDELVGIWHEICIKKDHFISPMKGDIVEIEIKKIFPHYLKGKLPVEIEINNEFLERLYKNQDSSKLNFKSDFVDVVKQLLTVSH